MIDLLGKKEAGHLVALRQLSRGVCDVVGKYEGSLARTASQQ